MFQQRTLIKVVGVVAVAAMLCGCPPGKKTEPEDMNPKMGYPRNTPIVISGGSITAHTLGDKDWVDAKKQVQCSGKDASGSSQVCIAAHIDPTTIKAVSLSSNFEMPIGKTANAGIHGNMHFLALEDSWMVVVGGVGPKNEAVSLTIQPVGPKTDCVGGSTTGTCFSISTTSTTGFGFGPRHETEGISAGKHNGRSVCQGKQCDGFSIKTVTIHGAATDPIEAECDDPNPRKRDHGCLVCLKPTGDNDPCEWK